MTEQGNTTTAPAGWYPDNPAPGYERYWTGTDWAGIRPIDTLPIVPSPVLTAAVIAQPKQKKSRWPWIAGGIIAFFIALFVIGVTIAAAGEAEKVPLSDKPAPVEEVQSPTEPIELPEQFDRLHPHPAGYVATITDLGDNPMYTVAARLVEADAGASIAAANQFNDLAPAGFKYVLVEYTVTGLSADKPIMPGVEAYDWQVVTENGAVSESAWVVVPGASISGSPDLYEGQTYVGQAAYIVPVEAASFTFAVFGLYVTL